MIDAQYLLSYAREIVAYTAQLQKPIARLYISHYHPDHLLRAAAFSAPVYALNEVAAKIAAVGYRVAREEHEKFGDDVPTSLERPTNIVKPGVEKMETIDLDFIHIQHAETQDALMVGLLEHGILITQDLVYNRVHAMVGERAFDTWHAALEEKESLAYDMVLSGHGAPGGGELYGRMRSWASNGFPR